MTKLIAILFLVFGLCAATSQSCEYGANLRDLYGYSNSLSTPKAYTDLKYCTSLASGSCCTDTEINNLGSVSDAYVANLTTMVSTRDLYLKNIKDNILPNLLTEISNFNTAATTFVTKLENSDFDFSDFAGSDDFNFGDDGSDDNMDWSEYDDSDIDWSEYDESDYDWSEYDDSDIDWSEYDESDYDFSDEYDDEGDFGLLDMFEGITNMTTALVDNANAIKANYGTYQTDRRTCILAMADIQNSARCLSCDPNADTKGYIDFVYELEQDVSDEMDAMREGTDDSDVDEEIQEIEIIMEYYDIYFFFNFDDATCNRLQAACKPYLADAQGQNSLIEAAYAATLITGLTSALTSFNNGNFEAGLEEIMAVFEVEDDSDEDEDTVIALLEGYVPEDCDLDGECDWICEGLFSNGIVDPLALIIGGDYSAELEIDMRRLAKKNRRLGGNTSSDSKQASTDEDSNGSWAPAQGSSGVTVSFAVDPANTNPSKKFGSLNLGNVFVGMMVVISSILLF